MRWSSVRCARIALSSVSMAVRMTARYGSPAAITVSFVSRTARQICRKYAFTLVSVEARLLYRMQRSIGFILLSSDTIAWYDADCIHLYTNSTKVQSLVIVLINILYHKRCSFWNITNLLHF